MIDSSDDERQLEDLAADGARRQMDAARVHEELASLHGALSSRHRALDAREAQLDEREQQLTAREEQLIADEALLRTLLSKEAARLQQEAKERLQYEWQFDDDAEILLEAGHAWRVYTRRYPLADAPEGSVASTDLCLFHCLWSLFLRLRAPDIPDHPVICGQRFLDNQHHPPELGDWCCDA